MKPFNKTDQTLHAILGLVLTVIPLSGAFFGVIAREYYQEKRKMEAARKSEPKFLQIIEMIDFFKRDLIFSYIGIAVGILTIAGIIWLVK